MTDRPTDWQDWTAAPPLPAAPSTRPPGSGVPELAGRAAAPACNKSTAPRADLQATSGGARVRFKAALSPRLNTRRPRPGSARGQAVTEPLNTAEETHQNHTATLCRADGRQK